MYEFHSRHGIAAQRGQGRHDANITVIRWCIADSKVAADFAAEFGSN
jgi:hypothetical protein